ncbi:hypothetical protein PAK_02886, partial [Pseudomonas aeruginosa PAK]
MALFALHTPKTPESVQVRRANNRSRLSAA